MTNKEPLPFTGPKPLSNEVVITEKSIIEDARAICLEQVRQEEESILAGEEGSKEEGSQGTLDVGKVVSRQIRSALASPRLKERRHTIQTHL